MFCSLISVHGKEWKDFEAFKTETHLYKLPKSDWLASDRKNNTLVWKDANLYNLNEILPEEYETIKQRSDFYLWYYTEIENKGHEVIWPKMAFFISSNLKLVKTFPYQLLVTKSIKSYAIIGSETVFAAAFKDLKKMFYSEEILVDEAALEWDEYMLYKEQFEWLVPIYRDISEKNLKRIARMAKGKFLYGLLVNRKVRFKGDISKANDRYSYAILTLRPYCVEYYK
jgi:hypothetical protein